MLNIVSAQSGFSQHSGVRSLGLANIQSVISDPSAAIGNPALLSFENISGIQLGAAQRFGLSDLRELQLSGGHQISANGQIFGSVQYFGFDAYNEMKFGVGYAIKLSEKAALSGQFNAYQFSIEEIGSQFLPGFQIGLVTKPFDKLILSVTAENPVKLQNDDFEVRLPAVLRIGARFSPSEKVIAYFEAEKDQDFDPSFKAAIEYHPISPLYVRFGAKTGPSTFHFGAGWQISEKLRIDFGGAYHTTLGLTPGIGLVYGSNANSTPTAIK